MASDILTILDVCLARLESGDSIEKCLADYPQLRSELEPLLKTVSLLSSVPRPVPSQQFCQTSQVRLMQRLQVESDARMPDTEPQPSFVDRWRSWWQKPLVRPLVPAVLAVLLVLAAGLSYLFIRGIGVNAEFSLSILHGSAEIQNKGSNTWLPAVDGMNLAAGSKVRTNVASNIVLTFIDGSTSKMEPNSEIAIITSEFIGSRQARIYLEQHSGTIWNHVQKSGDTPADYLVRTSTAEIAAAGTSFSTTVESDGATKVIAVEGSVRVSSAKQDVVLITDQQTLVRPGNAPEAPATVAEPGERILVSTGPAAVSSVLDPSGSSTGILSNGLSFNQITNSKNALVADGQQIEVAQPPAGDYAVVVRSLSDTPVPVNIQVKQAGAVSFEYKDLLQGTAGSSWLIRFKLDGSLAAGQQVSVEPLGNRTPEKVVETKVALDRATPVVVPAKPVPSPTPLPARPTSGTPLISPVVPTPAPNLTGAPIPITPTVRPVSPPPASTPVVTPTPIITPKPIEPTTVVITPLPTAATGNTTTVDPSPKPTLPTTISTNTTGSLVTPTPIKTTDTPVPTATSVIAPVPAPTTSSTTTPTSSPVVTTTPVVIPTTTATPVPTATTTIAPTSAAPTKTVTATAVTGATSVAPTTTAVNPTTAAGSKTVQSTVK